MLKTNAQSDSYFERSRKHGLAVFNTFFDLPATYGSRDGRP
jgi:hypothetical protein